MRYVVFHKPLHVVSSRDDQKEKIVAAKTFSKKKRKRAEAEDEVQQSIYDVAASKGLDVRELGLVGRLDAMTSGIMLFTDDSKLQSALLLPEDERDEEESTQHQTVADAEAVRKYKTKVYTLDVLATPRHKWGTDWSEARRKDLVEELSAPLTFSFAGVTYHTSPAEISILSRYRSEEHAHGGRGPVGGDLGWCAKLKVVLREGKHHQIRRLATRSKLIVRSLTRVSFAGGLLTIEEDALKEPGSGRHLREEEVKELRNALKLID